MQKADLEEDIELGAYKNFSLGLQYNVNEFDPTLNETRYAYFVDLLYNCTEIIIYNFESHGFGENKLFGGNNLEYFPDKTKVEFTILDKIKPKLNNYKYYEQLLDLDVLKIKGSSQSYELQKTIFSAINVAEFPGTIFQQQRRLCLENYDCKGTLESDTTVLNWYIDFLKSGGMGPSFDDFLLDHATRKAVKTMRENGK